jgi:hypothetical protein
MVRASSALMGMFHSGCVALRAFPHSGWFRGVNRAHGGEREVVVWVLVASDTCWVATWRDQRQVGHAWLGIYSVALVDPFNW